MSAITKKHRLAIKISVLLLFTAVLTSPMWSRWSTTVAAATSSGQMAPIVHHQMRDTPHMHVKNWMLQPTGIPGVQPLDPNTVPKFVNQLSRPPVFVPVGTKFDRSIGRDIPLYEVTENTVFQQILPPGFPKTKIYGYGGQVNTAKPGEPQKIDTVFSTPGPTFEATSNRRKVRYAATAAPCSSPTSKRRCSMEKGFRRIRRAPQFQASAATASRSRPVINTVGT